MVKSKQEIKNMKFVELHKYLDKLRKKGYNVPDLSSYKDTSDGRFKLRIIVNELQNKGLMSDDEPETKEDNSDSFNDCELYTSKTDCKKRASAQEVKEASQKCGIDIKTYKTKESQCDELDKLLEKLKKTNTNVVYKKFNDILKSEKYKKLEKLTKSDLVEMATEQGIELDFKSANKQSIIVAILEKNDQSKSKTPPPESNPFSSSQPLPTPPLPPSMPPPLPPSMPPGFDDNEDQTPPPLPSSIPPPLPSSMPPGFDDDEDEDEDEDSEDDKPLQKPSKKNEEVCFDFKLKDFMKLSNGEAKDLLKRNGITSFPESRERQFYYLCAKQDLTKQCNPDDYTCPDGLVCDISNDQGLCVKNNEDYVDSYMYKGKTIVGSKESIKKLKDSLENNDKKEALIIMLLESKYKGRNRQYFEEKDIKTLSKYVENMKKQSEPTEQKGNEPDEQKSNVDMEDLLAEVIEDDKEGDELKKTRNHVFKCLGLLS